jgi:hypothetical protein
MHDFKQEEREHAHMAAALNQPLLSVAYYVKWYTFTLTHPDGATHELDFGCLEEYTRAGESPYVDHVPNPAVVERMCESRGWELDELSHELLIGRWVLEALSYQPGSDVVVVHHDAVRT